VIPYLTDEKADAATKNPQMKLLFRLAKFFILDEDADELEWYVPAGILPSDLQSTLTVIEQFLETPFDLQGKKASQLLSKKTRRRRRIRSPSPDADPDDDNDDEDADPKKRKKKEKKKKEKQLYKSAQFIEDSDEEYGDIEGFLEQEKIRREKAALAAEAASDGSRISTNMKPTGTKKRRRKGPGQGAGKTKKQRRGAGEDVEIEIPADKDDTPGDDDDDDDDGHSDGSEQQTKPIRNTADDDDGTERTGPVSRPRPRPRFKSSGANLHRSPPPPDSIDDDPDASRSPSATEVGHLGRRRLVGRLVMSDDDEE